MASITKVASGYRVQLFVKGQRASKVLPTKREAQNWAAEESIRLTRVVTEGPGAGKTLRDALRRYAEEVTPTKRGESNELKRLIAFEGDKHKSLPCKKLLSDLTSDDLGVWRDKRLETTQRGSVLRDITLLGSVLETARREWKWIGVNPMRDVRKPANPDHRRILITGVQVRKMLREMAYHPGEVRSVGHACAVCFLAALSTGMRAGELCGLRWDQVHGNYASLPMTKNGKPRDVPLSRVAQNIIGRMKGYDPVLVFGIGVQSLDANFRKYRTRAKLEGFTFHDSRHTAATRLAAKPGIDVLTLCKIFGWSNTRQALIYYNPKPSDLAKLLD